MELSAYQIELLINGLKSLEGALSSIDVSIPREIADLKKLLLKEKQILENHHTLSGITTTEVATMLNCSNRYVTHLGKIGKIRIVNSGKRGRGHKCIYDTESVNYYLKHLEGRLK